MPDPSAQPDPTLFTKTQMAAIKIPPRLGSVPYLNARPLHWTIPEPVTFLEPNVLSHELVQGRLHAGLVPIYTILNHADLFHVADGYAIGSLNIVYSVVLVHDIPVVRIKTVALDPASRTSNHLVQVLLQKYYRIAPHYVSADEPADAQVMIGDPAITYRQAHPDERFLDLAQSWHTYTGLPFVFAAWAIRRDAPDAKGIARELRAAGPPASSSAPAWPRPSSSTATFTSTSTTTSVPRKSAPSTASPPTSTKSACSPPSPNSANPVI
jgi:chorismate dehydratase